MVLWSVFGKLCNVVHRVLNFKENKCSNGVVVARLNLGDVQLKMLCNIFINN